MTWQGSPVPGGWEYTHPDTDARIILDYLTPRGTGLEAWVELHNGTDIPVASGTINLMSPNATRPFLQTVGETAIPWAEGLRTSFYQVIEAWREGAATIDLASVEPEDLEFYVDPLVEQGGNTRLIAPGGSGKSLLAMAIALTVATGSRKFLGLTAQRTGPVLYLDWETNAATHARRIQALCEAADVASPDRNLILYRNEDLPLHRTMQAVQRAADRAEAVLLVVDSRVMAAGASGQSSGEDSTLNLNMALRQVGRPAVIVDHKAKENIEKGRKGGYGSVFNQNLARMEWEFTKYQKVGDNDHLFVLSLEKQNNVGHLPPLGFRLQTDGGKQGVTSARFTRMRAETIADPVAKDSLAEAILGLFASSTEPLSVSRISEEVDAPNSSVRAALSRNKGMFVNVVGTKGKAGLWRPSDDYLDAPRDDGVQGRLDALEEFPEELEDEPPADQEPVGDAPVSEDDEVVVF